MSFYGKKTETARLRSRTDSKSAHQIEPDREYDLLSKSGFKSPSLGAEVEMGFEHKNIGLPYKFHLPPGIGVRRVKVCLVAGIKHTQREHIGMQLF